MTVLTRSKRNILSSLAMAGMVSMAVPASAAENDTATLIVRIENAAPEGMMRLGLYSRALYPDDKATPIASADVSATASETVITLHNVPTGTYAIEVYQDLNGNGKMDTGFLGLPREPYGFSRDARPHLSKPDFDRVKFDVIEGQNSQTLHLQNLATLVAANQR
jgi:uncharacterized protein (DUF2141 family)